MIIADVYVPVVNKNYDFSINEKTAIAMVLEEISEMIAQKEGCNTVVNPDGFILCNGDKETILNPEHTLEQYGIGNGAHLILT